MSLENLEHALARELELLDYPRRDWVLGRATQDGRKILNCLIIGAGQGGLAVAWGLKREKVNDILVLDAAPQSQEGPWRTFARMKTLRTPKYLTGPDQGIPSLTIRAWYEAQFGEGAWDKLDFIPKEMWADYLAWYRRILELPVLNETRAGAIEWREEEGCFAVPIESNTSDDTVLFARTVVLATGIEGSGAWHTPTFIADNLPSHLYAHTHTEIGFPDLKGKKVGILGAGACAFDNAAVALEHGATSVDLFFRRREMVRVNPYRWAEFVGFLKHHVDLPDADKWKFIHQMIRMGQLPPASTYARAVRFENFSMHPGTGWTRVENLSDKGARVWTPDGQSFDFDFLIIATGFQTNLGLRPELRHIVENIALWRDRYTPPESQKSEDLARHPYLGPYFEFQPKVVGRTPYLEAIFNYTFGCLPSMGFGGASISGMKYSVGRVVAGVTRQLYLSDKDAFFQSLCDYDTPDF